MSKGSRRRQAQVPEAEFQRRWEATFKGAVPPVLGAQGEGPEFYGDGDGTRNWTRIFKRPLETYDEEGLVDTDAGLTFYIPRHERVTPPRHPEDGAYGSDS